MPAARSAFTTRVHGNAHFRESPTNDDGRPSDVDPTRGGQAIWSTASTSATAIPPIGPSSLSPSSGSVTLRQQTPSPLSETTNNVTDQVELPQTEDDAGHLDRSRPSAPDAARATPFTLPTISIAPFPAFGPIQTGRSTTPRPDRLSSRPPAPRAIFANNTATVPNQGIASSSDSANPQSSQQATDTAPTETGTASQSGGEAPGADVQEMDPFSSGLGSIIAQAVIGALANGAMSQEQAGEGEISPQAEGTGAQGSEEATGGAAARGAAAGAAAATRVPSGSFSLMIHPDGTVRQINGVPPPPAAFFAARGPSPSTTRNVDAPLPFPFARVNNGTPQSTSSNSASSASTGAASGSATTADRDSVTPAAIAAPSTSSGRPLVENSTRSTLTAPWGDVPDVERLGPPIFNFGPMRPRPEVAPPAAAAANTAGLFGDVPAPSSASNSTDRGRAATGFVFGSAPTANSATTGSMSGATGGADAAPPGDRPRDVPRIFIFGRPQTPASGGATTNGAGESANATRQTFNFQLPPPAPDIVPIIRWLGNAGPGGLGAAGNANAGANAGEDDDPIPLFPGHVPGMPVPPMFMFASEPTNDPRRAQDLCKGLRTLTVRLARRLERVSRKERSVDEGSDEGWKCSICFDGWDGAEDAADGGGERGAEADSALDLDAKTDIKALPCNHFFHRGCLEPWFSTKHTCPQCRFDVSPYARSLREPPRARRAQTDSGAPATGAAGSSERSREATPAPPGAFEDASSRRPRASHPANPPTRAEAAETMNEAASRHPFAAAIGAVRSIGSVVANAGRAVSAAFAPSPVGAQRELAQAEDRAHRRISTNNEMSERQREQSPDRRERMRRNDRFQDDETRLQRQSSIGLDALGPPYGASAFAPLPSYHPSDLRSEAATPDVDDRTASATPPTRPTSTVHPPSEYRDYMAGGVPIDTAEDVGPNVDFGLPPRPVFSASPLPMETARLPQAGTASPHGVGRTPTQQILDAAARDGITARPVPQRHLHIHGTPEPPAGATATGSAGAFQTSVIPRPAVPQAQQQQPDQPGVSSSASAQSIAPSILVSSPTESPGPATAPTAQPASSVPAPRETVETVREWLEARYGPTRHPLPQPSATGSTATPAAAAAASVPASGTSSLFGGTAAAPSSTGTTLFGSANVRPAQISSGNGLFGARPTDPPATRRSMFGSTTAATSSSGMSLFGSANARPARTSSDDGFGAHPPDPNLTWRSIFGGQPPPTSSTGTSLFSGTNARPAQSNIGIGLFGSGTVGPAPAAADRSLFGGPAAAPSSTGTSLFGGPSPQAAQTGSSNGLFGFGAATPTTSAGGSLFGATAAPSTSATSLSGGANVRSPQTSSSNGLFGSGAATPAPSAGGSLFGATSASSTNATSLFGGSNVRSAQTSSSNGSFGSGAAAPAPAAGGSLFGGAPPAEQTGTTTRPPTSIFASQPSTQPMTYVGSSLFGQRSSNPPGSGNDGSSFGEPSTSRQALTSGTGFEFDWTARSAVPTGQDTGLFGQGSANSTGPSTRSSIFGSAAAPAGTAPPARGFTFGSASPGATTTGLFGQPGAGPTSTVASTGSSLFVNATQSTSGGSLFGTRPPTGGGSPSANASSSSSLFGNVTPSTAGGSLFGPRPPTTVPTESTANAAGPSAQTTAANHPGSTSTSHDSSRCSFCPTAGAQSTAPARPVPATAPLSGRGFGQLDSTIGSPTAAVISPTPRTNILSQTTPAMSSTSAGEPSWVPGTQYPPSTQQGTGAQGQHAGQGANTATWDSSASPFSPPLAPRDQFSHLPAAFAAELRRMIQARDPASQPASSAGTSLFGPPVHANGQPNFSALSAPTTTTASADNPQSNSSVFTFDSARNAQTGPSIFSFDTVPAPSGGFGFGFASDPRPPAGDSSASRNWSFGGPATASAPADSSWNPIAPGFSFGSQASNVPRSGPSMFGFRDPSPGASATPTTDASRPAGSLFGSGQPSSASGAGGSLARPATQTSLFGARPSSEGQPARSSLFGGPDPANAGQPSTRTTSMFGGPAAGNAGEQPIRTSLFGANPDAGVTGAPTAPRVIFGQRPTPAAATGTGQAPQVGIASIFVDFGPGGPPARIQGFGRTREAAPAPRRKTIPLRTWLEKREQDFGWRCSKETCEIFPADDESMDYKDVEGQIRARGEAGVDLDLVPLFAAKAAKDEDEGGKGKGKARDEGQRDQASKRVRGNDGAQVASGSGRSGGSDSLGVAEARPSSSAADAPASPGRTTSKAVHRHEVTGEELACEHRFHPICISHHRVKAQDNADETPDDVDEEAQRVKVLCPRCSAIGWVNKVYLDGEGSTDEVFFPAECGHEGHEGQHCWHD